MNEYLFCNQYTLSYIKVEADTLSEAKDLITKKYGSNEHYTYLTEMKSIVTLQLF